MPKTFHRKKEKAQEKHGVSFVKLTKDEQEKLYAEIKETSAEENKKQMAEIERKEKEISEEKAKEIPKLTGKDRNIQKKALKIMKTEDTVEYIIRAFHKRHPGDEFVARILLISIGCQSVINSKGIQPYLMGKIGGGKSHCCEAMIHLVPSEYLLDKKRIPFSLTSKSLFYSEDLKPGTIIFSDDVILNDDLEGTIKRSTGTGFQFGTIHKTTIGRKQEDKEIPPRLSWWLTSVNPSKSEQLMDRQFIVNIDESEEQRKRISDYMRNKAKTGKTDFPLVKRDKICREIIRSIKEHEPFTVKIPFVDKIIWTIEQKSRDENMFYDMIKSFAVFNYQRRNFDEDGALIADLMDYYNAEYVYNNLALTQITKLTPTEIIIMKTINLFEYGATLKLICRESGLKRTNVYNHIHGKKGKIGLIERDFIFVGKKRDKENVYYCARNIEMPPKIVSLSF